MSTAESSPVYEELLDVLASSANVEQLLTFRLSEQRQARLDELLQRNREGKLTAAERGELEEFERLEHLGRMVKARARQKRQR
jgi:hypothetical protein